MKISQIIQETTTSGSVAPVELGFVKMQTRNPSVYGGNKVGNLLKGKKTSKPFANSVNESKMKDLAFFLILSGLTSTVNAVLKRGSFFSFSLGI